MPDLPSLFDRADGNDGRLGIATPSGVIIVNDNGTISDWTDAPAIKLRELANSPEVERAEQATITKTFVMDWNEAVTRITTLGRGTLMVDESGNVTRVLSSRLSRERPGFGVITVVSEGLNFDSPPDEFCIEPVELGIHIIKHPRYFSALNPASTDSTNMVTVGETEVSLCDVKQSIIRAIQAYMDAPIYPSEYNINGYFQSNILSQLEGATIDVPIINPIGFNPDATEEKPVKWDGTTEGHGDITGNCRYVIVSVPTTSAGIQLAMAAAREIIEKIWRQEDQPYVVGYQMQWITYWFRPPRISPGGFLDDPIIGGRDEVPDYFICPRYPVDSNRIYNIFTQLPNVNPQCYSVSGNRGGPGAYGTDYQISWLRKADVVDYQRTWFKLTRTWLGAPIGMWDQQLYSSGNRPSKPDDYVTTFPSLVPTS